MIFYPHCTCSDLTAHAPTSLHMLRAARSPSHCTLSEPHCTLSEPHCTLFKPHCTRSELQPHCTLSDYAIHAAFNRSFLVAINSIKVIYPRREIRSISIWGSIEVSFHLLRQERYIGFQKLIKFTAFFARKRFILTGGRTDGCQKCPLIFFILRYIKHYTYIYLYTKEKLSGQISCGFIFWSSCGVAPTIFKIKLLRRHFSKMSLKVDFLEKNNKDFPLK